MIGFVRAHVTALAALSVSAFAALITIAATASNRDIEWSDE